MTKALLNNVDHHDLKVRVDGGAAAADAVNLTIVFPTEFVEAAREYPVLFRRNEDGDIFAVALLGLDKGENLFLEADGWTTRYVPAALRRGPFSIVMQEQGDKGETRHEPMVYVDLDDPRVSRAEGRPLFLPHGGNSPYMEHVTAALRTAYAGIAVAPSFYAALQELALLKPVKLEIEVSDERRYDLDNFFTVDREVMAALDGAQLSRLHDAGFLGPLFAAAQSFDNIPRLIELKRRDRAEEQAPA